MAPWNLGGCMVRLYQKSDYPTVCQWWDEWKWPRIPEDSLPRIGAITENACAWLYQTDSDVCLIEWYITNPRLRKEQRAGILEPIVEQLCKTAKALGYQNVMSMVRNPHLIKRLNGINFSSEDENMTLMVRRL